MGNGWEKGQFLAVRFCRGRRKGSALKNLAGALHAEAVRYTLLVGREVKMEIPVKLRIDRILELDQVIEAHRLLENRETSGKILLAPPSDVRRQAA